MNKIGILILGLIFLTGCGTKRTTTQHKSQKRKVIRDRAKIDTNKKVIASKDANLTRAKLVIKPKTVFSYRILDKLYERKPSLNAAKIEYIKKYSVLAVNEMEVYKIPASITLAQGLLESQFGQSYLTRTSNNHFGIKCHKWEGERVYHDDDAKGECFRKYKYAERSYRDHSLFLSKKERYKKLFTFGQNDYKSWAKGLRKAGYATDKKYPEKLIKLIEEYELYVFDNLVLGDDYKFEPEEASTNMRLIGDVKEHVVGAGDTLYSISNQYGITVEDIKKNNNLRTDSISLGQKIKLFSVNNTILEIDSKKNVQVYVVKVGDTIYSIARKNNITIKSLKQKNQLFTDEISIGQKLIIE